MNRLRQKLNFPIKKKDNRNKLIQWQNDEKSVHIGICNYNVKYLGSIEVQECQGIHICEQAIQILLNKKVKHIKAVLYISSDAIHVVDQINKGLIIDQTIDKVSFCAPDRYHKKGFAYICRDGTTRRWICHGFIAIKETGERVSHSVGYAFQLCFEQKQKYDRKFDVTQNETSFNSFRKTSIIERIIDPQSSIIIEPILYSSYQKTSIIERPRPKGNNSDAYIHNASMRSNNINQ